MVPYSSNKLLPVFLSLFFHLSSLPCVSSHGYRDDDCGIYHKSGIVANSEHLKASYQSATGVKRGVFELANCSMPICEGEFSSIYCSGRLIATTWQFGMEETCPGSMMLRSSADILSTFDQMPLNITKDEFQKFCDQNFANTSYLQKAELVDWIENPPNVDLIADLRMKEFAKHLNAIWKSLGRRFTDDVLLNPDRHPVLSVPNPFIVPGGFFQVYFYWDSYWIIKGLLFSGMTKTVKDMLKNFAFIVNKTQGYIPNSGEIRLSGRSQPPLFTQMVADYYEETKDRDFLREVVPQLHRELKFWQGQAYRSIFIDGVLMYQYKVNTDCPRPENYKVDYLNGINGTNPPTFIWSSIASACESGWDFSSRWFAYSGPKAGTKYSIRTNYILPVDLNVFMCLNFATMARFYRELGEEGKALEYDEKHKALHNAINVVFWNDSVGVWLDYDLESKTHRNRFYPSNVFPLMTKNISIQKVTKVINYLDKSGALKFKGGLPTSMIDSNEQWDLPNGWAPLIHLFVTSLRASGHRLLMDRAADVALKWIKSAYNGLMQPAPGFEPGMWEKYDVRYDDGRPGKGGEYIVQGGFGWTNGAVLDLMLTYCDDVKAPPLKPLTKGAIASAHTDIINMNIEGTLSSRSHSILVAFSFLFCTTMFICFSIRVCRMQRTTSYRRLVQSDRLGDRHAEGRRLLFEEANDTLLND